MNEQKRNKHTGGKQFLCRILAALAVLALLVGIVLPGLGEDTETPPEIPKISEYILDRMECRELAGKLVPINLSCENEGIRLEVTWGAVAEKNAMFIYSMQDMEGLRVQPSTSLQLDPFPRSFRQSGFAVLDTSSTDGKITMAAFYHFESPEEITDSSMVALGVRALDVRGEKQMYIRGLLDKYGSRAKFTDLPEILNHYYKNDDFENPEYYTTEDYRNAGLKVLDYTDPISVRLHKNVVLNGIGVLDGYLHIQLNYVDNDPVYVGDFPHRPLYNVYITDNDGYHLAGEVYPLPVPLMLDTGSGLTWETEEFVLPWDPELQAKTGIRVNIVENSEILEGNWQVRVPLESVWAGDPAYLENK